ncbi:MAG: DUF1553 domain-containing protein [Verrucomicrobiaceae bacterium]|nr:DUF1553 domain-containing protein [Verrucomicrobiaceae bacterium]
MNGLPCILVVSAVTVLPVSAFDFGRDVLPVLRRSCFECHGSEKQKGDLRLDSKAGTLKKAGVIAPGKPDASDLIRRISLPRGDKDAMPKRGDALKPAEIESIRSWIAAGAMWPDNVEAQKHWAYLPPKRPALPGVKDKKWPKNEIDRFILARLEKEGITPSPQADAAVLARRLSLDLTGLPPALETVRRFAGMSDTSANSDKAYEALVDSFLESPEFGVKWARHWLDLARYADSHGFQRDDLRDVWAFRDWVVNALNADVPFDRFTIEQVAGDLLPGATPEQVIATGFHRCTPTNVEAGTEPEESRMNQVIDRVNTTGAVWLGTTLECCQCHNHKYDPFTMRDYYSLLAYFNNTEKEAERSNPNVPGSIAFNGSPFTIKDAARDAERARLTTQIAALGAQIKAREADLAKTKPAGGAAAAATAAAASSSDPAAVPLVPVSFLTESGSEFEQLDDKSILLKGDAPDVDTYTFEAVLPPGRITGLRLEALSHPSLGGDGPGRGGAARPNFVLDGFDVTLSASGVKDAQPLKFARAVASYSQNGFDVNQLVTAQGKGRKAWAIGQQFHQSHWAVFVLPSPLDAPAGSKISIVMPQHFGKGLTIGCLRISALSSDLSSFAPPPQVAAKAPAATPAKRKKRAGNSDETPAAPVLSADPQLAKLQRQQSALQKQMAALKPLTSEVMRELASPRMTAVLKRGEYTQPGEKVAPGTPAVIDVKAAGAPDRIALAQWLVSRENPLTARVTVNRWWAEIFGRGIVSTIEDFGVKGEPPTHPELLDWLAVELMERGWSMKRILKEIVMSAAYRQSSVQFPAASASDPTADRAAPRSPSGSLVDPANSLLWRGPRFRMDAEMIRDNALSIAGLLSLAKGGPSIRPPQPDGLWKKVGGQDYKYEVSPGEAQYRRGIYVVLKRGSPYPSFMNFDASQRMSCVVKRSRSNTPLQALTLLNDPVYVEATRAFARRISTLPVKPVPERIAAAFRIALARAPTAAETAVLERLFERQLAATKKEADAWYDVASAILNLDECITKG